MFAKHIKGNLEIVINTTKAIVFFFSNIQGSNYKCSVPASDTLKADQIQYKSSVHYFSNPLQASGLH